MGIEFAKALVFYNFIFGRDHRQHSFSPGGKKGKGLPRLHDWASKESLEPESHLQPGLPIPLEPQGTEGGVSGFQCSLRIASGN